jgi:hypothetical protein
MANALGVFLKGKTVLMKKEAYPFQTKKGREFKCNSGFGCEPNMISGTTIFGTWPDGTKDSVHGYDIEKIIH